MQEYADLVFEGMTLCGWIGARQGFVYLRGEYRHRWSRSTRLCNGGARSVCWVKTSWASRASILTSTFILALAPMFGGGRISTIESLEGAAGVPRHPSAVPDDPRLSEQADRSVNNVETFAVTAKIATEGGAWFASRGTAESKGTKLLSVSGDCERPGIYEYPLA